MNVWCQFALGVNCFRILSSIRTNSIKAGDEHDPMPVTTDAPTVEQDRCRHGRVLLQKAKHHVNKNPKLLLLQNRINSYFRKRDRKIPSVRELFPYINKMLDKGFGTPEVFILIV